MIGRNYVKFFAFVNNDVEPGTFEFMQPGEWPIQGPITVLFTNNKRTTRHKLKCSSEYFGFQYALTVIKMCEEDYKKIFPDNDDCDEGFGFMYLEDE